MTEAVDGMGKLSRDGRVDICLVEGEGLEGVNSRLNLARKFFEYEMLVFHLGHETGGLEEAFAVPAIRAKRILPVGKICDAACIGYQYILNVVDKAVMLGVEDLMNGAQSDVLVTAAITADKVQVEQFVIVGSSRDWGVQTAASCEVVIGAARCGGSAMRDVIHESGVNKESVRWDKHRSSSIALDET